MGAADREVIEERIRAAEEKERKERIKKRKKAIKDAHEHDRKTFWSDFKKFISRGNILDLAVAVVIANSFNAIVNGVVKNIIMPFITLFTSGVHVDKLTWTIREASGELEEITVNYGACLQSIIDFVIIAFTIFVVVRFLRNMRKTLYIKEIEEKEADAAKQKAEEEAAAAAKKAEEDKKAAEAKAIAEEEAAMRKEFYQNVREQSKLLKSIDESLKNK